MVSKLVEKYELHLSQIQETIARLKNDYDRKKLLEQQMKLLETSGADLPEAIVVEHGELNASIDLAFQLLEVLEDQFRLTNAHDGNKTI